MILNKDVGSRWYVRCKRTRIFSRSFFHKFRFWRNTRAEIFHGSFYFSINNSENTDSELSSNNDNGSTDLSSDKDLGTGSELSYDDDDELTTLNEHLKPNHYESSCQPSKDFSVKMMKILMLALIVIRTIAEKEILIGVLVDIVGQ